MAIDVFGNRVGLKGKAAAACRFRRVSTKSCQTCSKASALLGHCGITECFCYNWPNTTHSTEVTKLNTARYSCNM